MATYEPGLYEFKIVFYDPEEKLPPHVIVSNVNVASRRSDKDIAQDILNDAKRSSNQPVLRLKKPAYRLILKRR